MEDKRIITRFLKSELLIDNKNSSGVLNAKFLTPYFQFKIEISYDDESYGDFWRIQITKDGNLIHSLSKTQDELYRDFDKILQNIIWEADKCVQEEIDRLETKIAKLRFNNTGNN